jgi:hypothetical protein
MSDASPNNAFLGALIDHLLQLDLIDLVRTEERGNVPKWRYALRGRDFFDLPDCLVDIHSSV